MNLNNNNNQHDDNRRRARSAEPARQEQPQFFFLNPAPVDFGLRNAATTRVDWITSNFERVAGLPAPRSIKEQDGPASYLFTQNKKYYSYDGYVKWCFKPTERLGRTFANEVSSASVDLKSIVPSTKSGKFTTTETDFYGHKITVPIHDHKGCGCSFYAAQFGSLNLLTSEKQEAVRGALRDGILSFMSFYRGSYSLDSLVMDRDLVELVRSVASSAFEYWRHFDSARVEARFRYAVQQSTPKPEAMVVKTALERVFGTSSITINDSSHVPPSDDRRLLSIQKFDCNFLIQNIVCDHVNLSAKLATLGRGNLDADYAAASPLVRAMLGGKPANAANLPANDIRRTCSLRGLDAVSASTQIFGAAVRAVPRLVPYIRFNTPLNTEKEHLGHQLRFLLEKLFINRDVYGNVSLAVPFRFNSKLRKAEAIHVIELFLRYKGIDNRLYLPSIDWDDEGIEDIVLNRFLKHPDALPMQWPHGLRPRDTILVNRIVRNLNADQTFKLVVPRGQQNARDALQRMPIDDHLFNNVGHRFRLPPGIKLHRHQKETIAWMREMETHGVDSFHHVRLNSKDETLHFSPLLSTLFATSPDHGFVHHMLKERSLNTAHRGGILASTVGLGKTLMVVATALLDVAENDAKSDDDPTKFPYVTPASANGLNSSGASIRHSVWFENGASEDTKRAANDKFKRFTDNKHYQLAINATLFIVPVTLVKQTSEEITKFFPNAKIILYHAAGNRQNFSYADFARADFVITTYDVYKKQLEKEAHQNGTAAWCFSPTVYRTPKCFNNAFHKRTKVITQLSRIRWRRVVFDEFHKAGGLEAFSIYDSLVECDFIWAVSGTPLHPSLFNSGFIHSLCLPRPLLHRDGVYTSFSDRFRVSEGLEGGEGSVLRGHDFNHSFLGQSLDNYLTICNPEDARSDLPPSRWAVASQQFGNFKQEDEGASADSSASSKKDHIFVDNKGNPFVNHTLLSFLSRFMLRHTEKDSKEISDIKVTEKIVKVRFSQDERARYEEQKAAIDAEFQALVVRGRVHTRILQVMTLLNKLRHAAVDPFSVNVQAANALQFEGGAGFDNENEKRNIVIVPARIFGAQLFPEKFNLAGLPFLLEEQQKRQQQLNFLQRFAKIESLRDDIEGLLEKPPVLPMCALCADNVQQPVALRCSHMYCRECVLEFAKHQQNAGPGANLCPICRGKTLSDNDKKVLLSFPKDPNAPDSSDEEKEDDEEKKDAAKHQNNNNNANGNDDDEDSLLQPGNPLANASPKVRSVVRLIRDTIAQDPEAKFVIFTIYVAQPLLQELGKCGIPCAYIDGSTSMEHRGRYVKQFQDPASNLKAFILNTRVANAGLTLTAANHLIIVEPATAKDVDIQMLGRIRRIGQKKPEVFVHRLITEKTVEVQLRKIVAQQSLSLAGGKTEAQKQKSMELIEKLFKYTGEGETEAEFQVQEDAAVALVPPPPPADQNHDQNEIINNNDDDDDDDQDDETSDDENDQQQQQQQQQQLFNNIKQERQDDDDGFLPEDPFDIGAQNKYQQHDNNTNNTTNIKQERVDDDSAIGFGNNNNMMMMGGNINNNNQNNNQQRQQVKLEPVVHDGRTASERFFNIKINKNNSNNSNNSSQNNNSAQRAPRQSTRHGIEMLELDATSSDDDDDAKRREQQHIEKQKQEQEVAAAREREELERQQRLVAAQHQQNEIQRLRQQIEEQNRLREIEERRQREQQELRERQRLEQERREKEEQERLMREQARLIEEQRRSAELERQQQPAPPEAVRLAQLMGYSIQQVVEFVNSSGMSYEDLLMQMGGEDGARRVQARNHH